MNHPLIGLPTNSLDLTTRMCFSLVFGVWLGSRARSRSMRRWIRETHRIVDVLALANDSLNAAEIAARARVSPGRTRVVIWRLRRIRYILASWENGEPDEPNPFRPAQFDPRLGVQEQDRRLFRLNPDPQSVFGEITHGI